MTPRTARRAGTPRARAAALSGLLGLPALTVLVLVLAMLTTPRTTQAAAVPTAEPQGVVSGTVTDTTGAPMAGARVLVVELDRAVLTDAHGHFRIPGVQEGRYTVEVRREGYRAKVVHVDVPSSQALRVRLAEDPVPIDPVTVTVTRGAMSPTNSPLPATALGRVQLDRRGTVSLAHTLAQLPGVRSLSTGLEIGKPVIRGLRGARVLVLDHGMRLEDYSWSDEDGPAVDAAMADRVEVIRGPASVLYGADAVGGVVNVIPRPLPDAAGGPSFRRGQIALGGASNNRESDLTLREEGASGPWGARLLASGRFAEALHTPRGELDNTGFFSVDGEAALVRRGEWGSFTARYVHNGGEFKLLEEDAPPAQAQGAADSGPERKLGDDRVQLLGNFPMGSKRLETRVQLQRHHLIELEDNPDSAAVGIKVESEVFNLLLNTGEAEALLHHSLASNISGTVGVSGEIQGSTSTGLVPLIPDANLMSGGIFALEKMDQGSLTVLAGVRSDLKRTDATGQPGARVWSALTWSGGAALKVGGGFTLTGNVGTAWRAPTLFELYAEGPRLGEARYEIGRADLGKETSLNLDGGIRWDGPWAHVHVAAYHNAFKGFLYIQPTNEHKAGYQVFRYEQADATLLGGEASLEIEPTSFLSFTGQTDYVRGTNDALNEPLPLIPPARYDLEAQLHGPWPAAADQGYLSFEVEHTVAPTRLNPYDLAVGAYTLLDVGAGLRGVFGGRQVGVDLRVHNLANTAYTDFLSRYKAFALNPGRDITLRLRMGM